MGVSGNFPWPLSSCQEASNTPIKAPLIYQIFYDLTPPENGLLSALSTSVSPVPESAEIPHCFDLACNRLKIECHRLPRMEPQPRAPFSPQCSHHCFNILQVSHEQNVSEKVVVSAWEPSLGTQGLHVYLGLRLKVWTPCVCA